MYVIATDSFLGGERIEVALQQEHREDQIGGGALAGVEQPGLAIEQQAATQQTIEEYRRRPEHAGQPQPITPGQRRPRRRGELVDLAPLVAVLRDQPALQRLAVVVVDM